MQVKSLMNDLDKIMQLCQIQYLYTKTSLIQIEGSMEIKNNNNKKYENAQIRH